MLITRVLTAVNDNPTYTRYIPIFLKTWRKQYPKITPTIIFIGKKLPVKYEQYKDDIILFVPSPKMNTVLVSQVIRLFYPALLEKDDVVMISDIDMIPGRSSYFSSLGEYPDDHFISLRDAYHGTSLAMCYVAAKSSVWGEVFNIHCLQDIYDFFEKSNIDHDTRHDGTGWYTDQLLLYKSVVEWDKVTGKFILLNDRILDFKRLDPPVIGIFRLRADIQVEQFANQYNEREFSDAHIWSNGCKWTEQQLTDLIGMLDV